MGGGCFKAGTAVESPSRSGCGAPSQKTEQCAPFLDTPDLKAELAPVVHLAGRTTGSSNIASAKLEEVLEALSTASSPEVACAWLLEWMGKASPKSRTGLLVLLHRVLAHALEAKVSLAEELLAAEERENSSDIVDFATAVSLCKDALAVEPAHQPGVLTAVMVLSTAATSSQGLDGPGSGDHGAAVLDRIVLMFRPSLLLHIGSSARNFQLWCDMEAYAGLPPLEKHLALLHVSAKAVLLSMMIVPEGVPTVQVVVSRDNALADVCSQLPKEHACVLSPYFESTAGTKVVRGRRVEGGEGHGPRKEFFIATTADGLRCPQQKPVLPLFEFHRGTGQHWFSAYGNELENSRYGDDLRERYVALGKLLALAVVNRCKIAFALPLLFFHLLINCESPVSLSDLQGFDPVLHASLKKCLKMSQANFNSLKEVEGISPETTREEYVAEQVKSVLIPQAMEEMRRAFWCLLDKATLKGVGPAELRQMVCPVEDVTEDINIRKIFRVVMEDEMSECSLFAETFWSVVDGLTLAEKKLFLLFVTGLEAPPEPGTERLVIELPFSAFSQEEHLAMLSMLPQAHTCTNTLELPNYHDALLESGTVSEDASKETLAVELHRLLGEKLRLAIRETSGYELDAVDASTGELLTVRPTSRGSGGLARPSSKDSAGPFAGMGGTTLTPPSSRGSAPRGSGGLRWATAPSDNEPPARVVDSIKEWQAPVCLVDSPESAASEASSGLPDRPGSVPGKTVTSEERIDPEKEIQKRGWIVEDTKGESPGEAPTKSPAPSDVGTVSDSISNVEDALADKTAVQPFMPQAGGTGHVTVVVPPRKKHSREIDTLIEELEIDLLC